MNFYFDMSPGDMFLHFTVVIGEVSATRIFAGSVRLIFAITC